MQRLKFDGAGDEAILIYWHTKNRSTGRAESRKLTADSKGKANLLTELKKWVKGKYPDVIELKLKLSLFRSSLFQLKNEQSDYF